MLQAGSGPGARTRSGRKENGTVDDMLDYGMTIKIGVYFMSARNGALSVGFDWKTTPGEGTCISGRAAEVMRKDD